MTDERDREPGAEPPPSAETWPRLRRVSLWLANVETTPDLDDEAAQAESRRNRRWWKRQEDR